MSNELIVFTSPTCAPCKQLKPDLEALQAEFGFPMRYVSMEPANAQEFMKFGVRTVPTVVCPGPVNAAAPCTVAASSHAISRGVASTGTSPLPTRAAVSASVTS